MRLRVIGICEHVSRIGSGVLLHYDDARDHYQAALTWFRETGDTFNQEVLLYNLSRLEQLQGNFDAALKDATQASELAIKIGDPRRLLAGDWPPLP
jgi:tetratricopeptide (TPR) repeat protein